MTRLNSTLMNSQTKYSTSCWFLCEDTRRNLKTRHPENRLQHLNPLHSHERRTSLWARRSRRHGSKRLKATYQLSSKIQAHRVAMVMVRASSAILLIMLALSNHVTLSKHLNASKWGRIEWRRPRRQRGKRRGIRLISPTTRPSLHAQPTLPYGCSFTQERSSISPCILAFSSFSTVPNYPVTQAACWLHFYYLKSFSASHGEEFEAWRRE